MRGEPVIGLQHRLIGSGESCAVVVDPVSLRGNAEDVAAVLVIAAGQLGAPVADVHESYRTRNRNDAIADAAEALNALAAAGFELVRKPPAPGDAEGS